MRYAQYWLKGKTHDWFENTGSAWLRFHMYKDWKKYTKLQIWWKTVTFSTNKMLILKILFLDFYHQYSSSKRLHEVSTSYSEKTTKMYAKAWWEKKTTTKTDDADHYGEKQFFFLVKYLNISFVYRHFFAVWSILGLLFFTYEECVQIIFSQRIARAIR